MPLAAWPSEDFYDDSIRFEVIYKPIIIIYCIYLAKNPDGTDI